MRHAIQAAAIVAVAALALREWALIAVLRDRAARRLEYARSMRDRLVAEEMQP